MVEGSKTKSSKQMGDGVGGGGGGKKRKKKKERGGGKLKQKKI